jgi:hypothetical protein
MKMIRHHDKLMKPICAPFPARKNPLNQDFREIRYSEKFSPFPRGRRNEIRGSRKDSVRRLAHRS